MPSKYDAVLPTLPPLPVQDFSWQAKVDAVKLDIIKNISVSPSNLAKMFAKARLDKEQLEEQVSDLNTDIEALTQLLIASQEEKNTEWGQYGAATNTLRLVSGDKIEVRREPYATVEDKDANREWAVKNGLERMLALSWQTINSLTKELLLKGESEPAGVKVFVKSKIVFTRMKKDE